MKVTKLAGVNVLQYPSIEIEFEDGFININGVNGAGKTSIFKLIELGLYGGIKGVPASEIKYDQAKKSQKWSLELSFEKDGNEYVVCRHETTAKAKLFVNGKAVITAGQKEVTDHIVTKVLRMDQTSFSNAFYARQDELDTLMSMRKEDRKREIANLLRLDKLDDSLKRIREDKNCLDTVIDEKSKFIKDAEYFIQKENELTATFSSIQKEEEGQEKTVKEKESHYQQLLNQKEKLDVQFEKHQVLVSEHRDKTQEQKYLTNMTLNQIQNELTEVQNCKQEFADLQQDVQQYDSLSNKLQEMQKRQLLYVQRKQLIQHTDSLKNRLTAKKERLDDLKNSMPNVDYLVQIKKVDDEITALDGQNSSLNNDIIELKSELSYVANEGKRIKSERNELQQLGSNSFCPTCKRPMGEHFHSLANEYNMSLENLAGEHRKLTAQINQKNQGREKISLRISSLKQEKIQLEAEQRKLDSLQNELKILHKDFQNDKQDFLKYQNQLDNTKDVNFDEEEFNNLNNEVKQLLRKKERFSVLSSLIAKEPKLLADEKEAAEKIKVLSVELSELEKKVKDLNFNNEEYRNFQNKINSEVSSLRSSEKELSLIREKRKNTELLIEQLDKEKQDNEKLSVELEKQKRELGLLLITEEIHKNFKVDRMSKFRPRIEKIMQELLAYITDGKYDTVTIDDHYNIFVYRNGIAKPSSRYSGGEQKLIALCLRLAISRILTTQDGHQNFDYLGLDEVLGSMDEGRQRATINALRRLKSIFKQIIMITHNSSIKSLFDKTLQVEQNTDLSSRAFWVTETDDSYSEDYSVAN